MSAVYYAHDYSLHFIPFQQHAQPPNGPLLEIPDEDWHARLDLVTLQCGQDGTIFRWGVTARLVKWQAPIFTFP